MNTKNSGSKKKVRLIVLAAAVAFVVSCVLWPSDDGGRDGGDAVASRKPIASVKSRVTHAQAARQAPRKSATNRDKTDAEPPELEQEPLFEVNGKCFRSLAEAVDAEGPRVRPRWWGWSGGVRLFCDG